MAAQSASMGTAAQANPRSIVPESDYAEHSQRRRSRSRPMPEHPCARWTKLDRACRIALLETDQPASVEVIHDRIVKRGSFVFLSYERAFRTIALAMARLVRRGEAILLLQQGEICFYKISNSSRFGEYVIP